MKKVPVGILAEFTPGGAVSPQCIIWSDGRSYPIRAILDVRTGRNNQSLIRYTVRMHDCETYLYRQEDRWFVEGK